MAGDDAERDQRRGKTDPKCDEKRFPQARRGKQEPPRLEGEALSAESRKIPEGGQERAGEARQHRPGKQEQRHPREVFKQRLGVLPPGFRHCEA